MQSFAFVAPHLELAIYLESLELLSMRNQVLLTFFCRNKFKFAGSAFSSGYGYNAKKTTSNLLRFFNFQNNNS